MKKALLLGIIGACTCLPGAGGQNYLMNGSGIQDCNGTFYDSGGPGGNYAANQSLVTTICADNSGGTHIRLDFSGVELAPGDELCFYDGSSIAAPLLSCASDYDAGEPFVVQATAVNPGGCLTVSFDSDASGQSAGWAAVISCVASCQQVLADLVGTNPAAVPADTGWIDICPGERVFFTGQGVYPQNNFAYAQSDLTTTFEWNFGDGGIAYGPTVSHRYTEPGGYFVQLVLTDVEGCPNTNLINQRIRVAPRPSFGLTGALDNTICAGDTLQLSAAVDSGSTATLTVLPGQSAFAVEGSRSDSLPLPDGTGVPYETSILFTEFSPGQVLTNANDLESICVNMEHSWMRDIEISLTCPNGQSIVLHNHPGQIGGQVFLGVPIDNDGFNPTPGEGYDYCWTPNAPNPTWIQFSNNPPGGWNGTLPPGDYSSFDPISDLVGCPLNGEWTITVLDLWASDNGYIFAWSLKFKDQLYPDIEQFSPQFLSWNWNNHPSIFFSTPDSIAASPQNAGTAGYAFTVNDAFGCSWDTLVQVAVLPFTHPDCYSCTENFAAPADTTVCGGAAVTLDAGYLGATTQEVRFEAFPDYRLGNANHPHSNPYASPLSVNSLGYATLSNPAAQIVSVCVDIETDFDADLSLFLRSPDGKLLELSSGNGGAGDNYKIACFSPAASTPVVGSAAPFNGTYLPEGNWNNLAGAQVNGNWQLLVSDGFGTNQFGRVKWWSLGFNFNYTVAYAWSNPASLSCPTCPAPIATPASNTSYIVITTDNFNCQHRDTVTVAVSSFFPAPTDLSVVDLSGGTMTWAWNPVPGATGYEVRVNGGPWQPANGGQLHIVGGLQSGDAVELEVRALGGTPTCPPAIASASQLYIDCNMVATVMDTQPALCAGQASGSVLIGVTDAQDPVFYIVNGTGPIFDTGLIDSFFLAGDHLIVVEDSSGCRDTVTFTITEPDSIALTTSAQAVACHGDSTGSLTGTAAGGTGALTLTWQSCAGGPVIPGPDANGLAAGCYRLTVADVNGCTVSATDTVPEPPAFGFTASQDSVSCAGLADGSATIAVSGGTPPYAYAWDTGAGGATAGGLEAGLHPVTVTDALGCQAVTLATVLEPAPLVVDSMAVHDVACYGGNNGSATVFPAGGQAPYEYDWETGSTSDKAQALTAGTYLVTIADANGCTVVGSATVGQPTELLLDFTSVAPETCPSACDGSIAVMASGGIAPYGLAWSDPAIPPGTTAATGLCPGSYTVTVTDDRGCTLDKQASVAAVPAITATLQPVAPACASEPTGSAAIAVSGGNGANQYLWSNGAATSAIQDIPCGPYAVTVTDANQCTAAFTVEVPCPDSLIVSQVETQPVRCAGESNGEAAIQVQGGSGPLEYLWNDPNGQSNPVAENLPAGAYTVTVTDAAGCTVTAQATITEPLPLQVSAVPTAVRCFGGSDGQAAALVAGGTPPYSYGWNALSTDSVATGLIAGGYEVTVTDSRQCTAVSAPVTVIQPSTPVSLTASQTRTACYGLADGEASASAAGGNGQPFTFAWSNGQAGPTAGGLAMGVHTVTVSDLLGCTTTQSVDIQQFDSISVLIITVPPSCFGISDGVAAVNLVEGGAGQGDTLNYHYQWSRPGAPDATVVTGLEGGQTYGLTVTDLQGCSGTVSFNILPKEQIALSFTTEDVSCAGYSDGEICVSAVSGGFPASAYAWSDGSAGPCLTGMPAGAYGVTVTNSEGCQTDSIITIVEPLPLGLALAVQPLICPYDSTGVVAAQVQGGTQPYSYQWNPGGADAQLTGLGPGTYFLTLTDAHGCQLTDSAVLVQPPAPAIALTGTDPNCFGGRNGRIRLEVSGGLPPYRYRLNDDPFGGTATFIGLTAGIYRIQVRDGNDCITTLHDTLQQPLPIEINLGPDTTILLGDSLAITAEVSNAFGLVEYAWKSSILEDLVCLDPPECSSILVGPYQATTYRVTVVDENNCRGESSIRVVVEKPRGIFVPTGFSPNGDPQNRRLIVHGISRTVREVVTFRVFDRWGELVYEDHNFPVNDTSRGWDGQFRGEDCDPAVYAWVAEVEYLDGYREVVKGNTTLIR